MLSRVVKQVPNTWFNPKHFEQKPEVYERLGVRTFKKYMPTSGDLVYRLVWKRLGALDLVKPNSIDSLRDYEKFTRIYETIHLTLLGVGAATFVTLLQSGQVEAATITVGISPLLIIYPILVQRYNRSRLYNLISRMESRNRVEGANTQDNAQLTTQ